MRMEVCSEHETKAIFTHQRVCVPVQIAFTEHLFISPEIPRNVRFLVCMLLGFLIDYVYS